MDIGKDVVGAGTTYTETMIQKYPDLNCILAYGDAAATEAVEAVKAAGMNSDDFGIFACDGTDSAVKYIADNDVMRGTLLFNSIAERPARCCTSIWTANWKRAQWLTTLSLLSRQPMLLTTSSKQTKQQTVINGIAFGAMPVLRKERFPCLKKQSSASRTL